MVDEERESGELRLIVYHYNASYHERNPVVKHVTKHELRSGFNILCILISGLSEVYVIIPTRTENIK